MSHTPSQPRPLWPYFAVTYLAVAANASSFLRLIERDDLMTCLFSIAAILSHCALFLVPVAVVCALARLVLWRSERLGRALMYAVAVLGASVIHVALVVDASVFRMYGLHLNNGFVMALLQTRGGIASLEAGTTTLITFAAMIAGLGAFQAFLLWAVVRSASIQRFLHTAVGGWRRFALIGLVVVMALFQTGVYMVSAHTANLPVLSAAGAVPFYLPITSRKLMKRLGVKRVRSGDVQFSTKASKLSYPLKPVAWIPPARQCNIVLLVAESWRWDMLDPEIMPATWSFAKKSTRFLNHYSGGHDTRPGMFTLFYGVYGTYWTAFRNNRRAPVLMDVLAEQNYQVHPFTSTAFTYPEFDQTIFARIPLAELKQNECRSGESGWAADNVMVPRMLDSLDRRDRNRPFFAFLFMDSAHAPYLFPKESAIRKPYAEDINYATMDTKKDIHLIKNRYINACNQLDVQYARVFRYLEQNNLMDSTIVVLVGDHGEEFMEKGHWGHTRGYSEEQIRTPLVIRAPGRPAAEVAHMTSHHDVAPTLMNLLGVTNPPEDYCLGFDLFGPVRRQSTVAAGWSSFAFIDNEYKAIFQTDIGRQQVTTKDDAKVPDVARYNATRAEQLKSLGRQLTLFGR